MNLPLVFDIALGLAFIYLILSLLASEVQELISTLLQWRAEHLKKSIEVLITGDSSNDSEGAAFTDRLYNSPLLKALNQEAKGPLATFFRTISHRIGESYRWITRTRNIFGQQKSGPSYIPAETFATALLEDLNIKEITHQKSREVLEQAADEKLDLTRSFLDVLRQRADDETLLILEYEDLRYRLSTLQQDFTSHQLSFPLAIDRLIAQFDQFLNITQEVLANDERYQDIIHARLPYLKQSISTRKLEPTIAAVIESIIESNTDIPPQLKRNLISLAQEAQIQANELADGIRKFEGSLAQWFDRAMDRASGVYKRNSKGIAVLLGFVIAITSNADTLYVLTRLSRDSVLRSSIVRAADQLVVEPDQFNPDSPPAEETGAVDVPTATTQQLQEVKDAVQVALDDLPLPVGWTPQVVEQQKQQASNWQFPILRRLIGWFITGIALSMGASFWYNLIGKIIRVRNTGGSTK